LSFLAISRQQLDGSPRNEVDTLPGAIGAASAVADEGGGTKQTEDRIWLVRCLTGDAQQRREGALWTMN